MDDMELFSTPLGEYMVLEYFFYYDRPRIFSCVNKLGNKFVAFLVDESEWSDRWFLVAVTENRLSGLRRGQVSIRDCIKYSEDGSVWEIGLAFGANKESRFKLVPADSISDDDLPGSDSFIHMQDEIRQRPSDLEPKKTEAIVESARSKRDVLDMDLSRPGHEGEINC